MPMNVNFFGNPSICIRGLCQCLSRTNCAAVARQQITCSNFRNQHCLTYDSTVVFAVSCGGTYS